jgi:hypothetical protein
MKWKIVGLLLAICLLIAPAPAQDVRTITGQVLDAAGKPVADADVAGSWLVRNGEMAPVEGVKTDADGKFSMKLPFFAADRTLLAIAKDRKIGALTFVEREAADKPIMIRCEPLVRVRGQFFCKELDRAPSLTSVSLVMLPRGHHVLSCSGENAVISFRLPPGKYHLHAHGKEIVSASRELSLTDDKLDVDLKTIDVPATVIAKSIGKPLPDWTVTDALNASKEVKLADFKGKWVLLEFWGFG